jgi:hypothetical protein
MKKYLVVKDTLKLSIIEKITVKLFEVRSANFFGGSHAIKIINDEQPDYLFLKLRKPVNGETVMSILRLYDEDDRLRVSIFYLPPLKDFIRNIFSSNFKRKAPLPQSSTNSNLASVKK